MAKARYYRGKRALPVSLHNILKVTEMLRGENLMDELIATLEEHHLDLSIVKDLAEGVVPRGANVKRLTLRRSADVLMGFGAAVGGAETLAGGNAGSVPLPPAVINGVKRFMVTSRLASTNATAKDVAESRQSFECKLPPA